MEIGSSSHFDAGDGKARKVRSPKSEIADRYRSKNAQAQRASGWFPELVQPTIYFH
jgi:hypothetical protein